MTYLFLAGLSIQATNAQGDAQHRPSVGVGNHWIRDGSIQYILEGHANPFDEVGVESYSEYIIYSPEGWDPGITDGGTKTSGSSHVGVKFIPSTSKGNASVEEVKFRVKYRKYAHVHMYEGPLDSHNPFKPPHAQVLAKAGGRISYLSASGTRSDALTLSSFAIGVYGDASNYSISLPTASIGILSLPSVSFTPDTTGDQDKTIPSTEGHFDINASQHYTVSKDATPEFLRPIIAQVNTETDAFGTDSEAKAVCDLVWYLVAAYPQRLQSYEHQQDIGSTFVFATP